MTVEQLDKARVLISLKLQDMEAYAISIDKLNIKDSNSKEALRSILHYAFEKFGINSENKAVLVEAMPHREGMIILVTVDALHSLRKVYRIKKPKTRQVCRFDSAEGLLSCIEHLKAENIRLLPNSLWQYKKGYYLLFEFSGTSPKAKMVLSEYARCYSFSLPRIARIKEAGVEIIGKNAVKIIAESMNRGD